MREAEFTIEERNKLIAEIIQLRTRLEELRDEMDDSSENDGMLAELELEHDKTQAELETISEAYTNGLARIEISRCPFTEETLIFSCDTDGLDGPWWDAENPLRLIEEQMETYFALTGSVNILGNPPDIPFIVKPGPAVPWVSPRLLENDDICAVLSYVKIGLYDAYVVVYFSKDRSYEIERINTWGTDSYLAEDADGAAVMGSTFEETGDYNFDLAKWITQGKLKWISVGDRTLELQDSIDNCPYLDLEGYQYPVLLRNGTLENCMIDIDFDEDEPSEEKEINFCPDCGSEVESDNNFCAKCGYKLR